MTGRSRVANRSAPIQLSLLDTVPQGTVTLDTDPMRRVRDLAARVASLPTTVLITGESGVGGVDLEET